MAKGKTGDCLGLLFHAKKVEENPFEIIVEVVTYWLVYYKDVQKVSLTLSEMK